MKDFIFVKDALTNKPMIIRKSMICSVEERTKDGTQVSQINYIDNRPPEYVLDSLNNILNALESS